MKACANRGCSGTVALHHLTRCNDCLLGTRRLNRMLEQRRTVEELPPFVAPAGAWGFRVAGVPVAWNNALVRWRGRRPFLSEAARAWKRSIAIAAVVARPTGWPMGARYEMDLHCVFANPRADRDGPLKLVQDALNGIAWNDDDQVVDGKTTKDVDAAAPRIEVVIRLAAQGTLV